MHDHNTKKLYSIALYFMQERELQPIRQSIFRQIKADCKQSPFELPKLPNEFWKQAAQIEIECKELGIEITSCFCESYPHLLFEISDWPPAIFRKGEIAEDVFRVAVVGARNCSTYGLATARKISRELAALGVEVVSGLAFGIDSAAHEGALNGAIERGGRAGVAVLPCGLDKIYPTSHTAMAERLVASGGALVSEYPPGIRPREYYFLRRNRIISGLCSATIVVEAKLRSGALSTARHAMEQNRDIFAVPGRIDSELSAGTNRLIEQGVSPVLGMKTLLDYLDDRGVKFKVSCDSLLKNDEQKNETLEQCVLNLIKKSPLSFDSIVEQQKVDPRLLMTILSRLELEGAIIVDNSGLFVAT